MRKSFLFVVMMITTLAISLSGPVKAQAPFTAGNIVVYRVGDGTATLANTGNAVFLDEYTPSGTLVQSIPMPTVTSGANFPLVSSGTATSEGLMTRSTDGNYLVMSGYGTTIPYASNLVATVATVVPRVVGIVSASGSVNTSTALTDYASGNNPRGACSIDGTSLWVSGGAGAVRYATAGSTTSVQLTATPTNFRAPEIFGGQLYSSTQSGAFRVTSIGTGLPTVSGQTTTNLPGLPTSTGSPYQFFMADLDPTVTGEDVLYYADDATGGGIVKYSKVAGTWVLNNTITLANARGLTGTVSGTTVTLYCTTNTSDNSSIVTLTDPSGYNASNTGTIVTLVTSPSGSKKAFRGIAFAPAATAITAPTFQASNFTFSGISQTQMNVSVSPGNGGGRIIKINTSNSFTAPVNNTFYTGNSVYAGSGEQVVYAGSGITVPTVTGLSAGITYYFHAYEYNMGGSIIMYNTTDATGNPASQATAATPTAPLVTTPTATTITATSALLGGTIVATGGSAILERGTVWSTTTPVTISDHKVAEGGTSTGVFTHTRTGLPNNTLIHYAAYATNSIGTTLSAEGTFTTLLGEPTNHAANFTATVMSSSNIVTTWLDNDGTQPATGFLILANKTGIFTDPVDGVPVTNYFGLNDSSAAVNVAHGVQTYNWYGLISSTHFYFKIYAYTNTGSNIDYKTVPSAPATDGTTSVFVPPLAAWTFDATAGAPNTPLTVAASFGIQSGTASLYADGTNGSSAWVQATELNSFAGTTLNDPREGPAVFDGMSYCEIGGGTGVPANGKYIAFKFSMTALQDATLTFATRWSSNTAFNTHEWEWSTNGVTFTPFGTNTAPSNTTFTLKTLDLSGITSINGAPEVYLRVKFSGATGTTSNNRLDNIVIRANAASSIPPTVVTALATNVEATTATLNGTVNANNQSSSISFEYGITTSYGSSVSGAPPTLTGGTTTSVNAALTGLAFNTTYHYRIKATNASGTSYGEDMTFITTCPVPADPGTITGPATVCANGGTETYSVDPIQYATLYLWSIPAGAAIVAGDGTPVIHVQFPSGTVSGEISVFGSNDCGDGNASLPLAVTVNQPQAVSVSITPSANPVAVGTSVTFTATPVNGGATPVYAWYVNAVLQPLATLSTFTYIPSNADVVYCSLNSSLSCTTGNPATSNQITMTVSGPPVNLSVSGALASGQNICYNATSTITVAGSGSTFTVASGATATMIAGSKISYLPGTSVASGGKMHGYIAPSGPWCPAVPMVKESGKESETNSLNVMKDKFRIFPNPTNGDFTVERTGASNADEVKVEVINMVGSEIFNNSFYNFDKQKISVSGNTPGIYFVKITSGQDTQTVKIILTR